MKITKQFVLLITLLNLPATTLSTCQSTQYMEMGGRISFLCSFSPNFECVVWYKIPGEGPLITLEGDQKSGPGYDTGEYDISSAGQLQINNVSLKDDRFFRVVVLYNKDWEDDIREDIRVYVYVKPAQAFPKIDVCEDDSYCLKKIDKGIEITCSVIKSRPTIRLKWLNVGEEERELESINSVDQFDHTASSSAVTTVHIDEGNRLEVLLCRALATAPVMEQTEAIVLLVGNIGVIPWKEFDNQLVEINDQVVFDIKLDDVYAVVWKKLSSASFEYETVGHYAHGQSRTRHPDFLIKADGSFQIETLRLEYEGEYICIFATPLEQNIRKFIVEVFIPPSPLYTTISGCTDRENCQMDIAESGSLTCSLKGIRPVVHVEWFYPDKGYSPIRFTPGKTTVKRKGSIFDIIVTTNFEIIQENLRGDFNVSCRALGLSERNPQMSSSVTLHPISGINPVRSETTKAVLEERSDAEGRSPGVKFSIALNVITCCTIIIITVLAIIGFRKGYLNYTWRPQGQRERTCEAKNNQTPDQNEDNNTGDPETKKMVAGSQQTRKEEGQHASTSGIQNEQTQHDKLDGSCVI